jgi:hypothetical protein
MGLNARRRRQPMIRAGIKLSASRADGNVKGPAFLLPW